LTEARQVAKALGVPWNSDQSGKEGHGQ
jgi:hypothetical protein